MLSTQLYCLKPLLLAFISALLVTLFYIPKIVNVAVRRRLTDKPGHRKVHKHEIPTLGGVGIFAGFSFGFLLTVNGYIEGVTCLMIGIIIIFFAGLQDDLVTIRPSRKIMIQVCAALIVSVCTGLRITSFHGFLGIYEIPDTVSYLTTVFLVIVIVNSLNLIDGIDGLAATIGIIECGTLGYWSYRTGDVGFTLMSVSLIGALSVFLLFNLSRGKYKIFMGDTGSMVIGFIIALMIIRFNEIEAAGTSFHSLVSAPAVSIGILVVPLFDTLRVMIIRLARGQSPFVADKRHIHHMLLRAGFSHRRSTFLIACGNIILTVSSFLLDHIGIFRLALVLGIFCLILTLPVYYLVSAREGWENLSQWRQYFSVSEKAKVLNFKEKGTEAAVTFKGDIKKHTA